MRHSAARQQPLASCGFRDVSRFLVAAALLAAVASPARPLDERAPLSATLHGLAEAAQSLAEGDAVAAEKAAREALAAVPAGETARRATLVLGLALRDQQRFGEAAETIGRVAGELPATLAPAALLERAQALFYAGRPSEAASEFGQVGQSRAMGLAQRARWREADASFAAGDAPGAVRAYEALLAADGGVPSPGARLALASALREAGQAARAVEMLRALWIDSPADATGRAAARALRAWRDAGGPVPAPTPEQRLARAARFLELSLPRRALRVLDRLESIGAPPEPATRAALLRAFALLQIGRRAEARALALRLQKSADAAAGTRTGAQLVLARAAARSGRVDEAAARYRTLAASRDLVPGLPPARARDLPEDARFLAAWLYFDAGQYARAASALRAFARARPSAPRAEDARWFEAWSLLRLGQREQARAALSRLARGGLVPAALYWQARLTPPPTAQRELYRRVLREAPPGSWYWLLATDRLARLGEHPATALAPAAGDPPGPSVAAADAESLERAVSLLATGLRGEAIAELRLLAAGRLGAAAAAEVAQLAAAAGDSELPFRIARDHLPPTRRTLRWLFPVAFPDLMTASSEAAGCDRELYLAVMRRESAFRPDARSGAGAVGLVQLIPPTAERLASLHRVPRASVRALEAPEVSVPLGAAYLALLVDRFREPAVVLAAYNAGPPAAATWARDRGNVPLDEWVEGIPFRETRRYVKNVLADSVVYRALWRGGTLSIDGARIVPPPSQGVGF